MKGPSELEQAVVGKDVMWPGNASLVMDKQKPKKTFFLSEVFWKRC